VHLGPASIAEPATRPATKLIIASAETSASTKITHMNICFTRSLDKSLI
jgi:hypothetical protein